MGYAGHLVRDLGQASFIEEWIGPRQRVPVFDTAGLRDFGADPLRRFFLIQLLASYTSVTHYFNLLNTGRMDQECALNPYSMGDAAHGKILVDATTT